MLLLTLYPTPSLPPCFSPSPTKASNFFPHPFLSQGIDPDSDNPAYNTKTKWINWETQTWRRVLSSPRHSFLPIFVLHKMLEFSNKEMFLWQKRFSDKAEVIIHDSGAGVFLEMVTGFQITWDYSEYKNILLTTSD